MDAAILFAAAAGVCWALNIVVVSWALPRTGAAAPTAAFVGISVAAAVAGGIAILSGAPLPGGGDVARFALVGAIAPGSSQGLFVASIGSIGPSRSSVLVGMAPMFSVVLAIAFLGENWQLVIVVGTLLTVAGGALISWEPGLGFRRLGVLLAIGTAVTFAVRDVVASQFNTTSSVSSWWSGAVVLGAAAVVLGAMAAASDGARMSSGIKLALPEFLASGLMIGLALPLLLEALDRGRVGVVAPFSNAVQNLVVVAIGSAVFGKRERSARVLVALAMVVGGGALITAA